MLSYYFARSRRRSPGFEKMERFLLVEELIMEVDFFKSKSQRFI